jgi:HD-GYP domain-containing protein (c-di-GMP phosphodiesterase class II)
MSDAQEDLERQQLLLGRELVSRWTGLLKALSLYDWRHSAVRAAAERVLGVVRELGDGSPIELAIRQDLIYLEGVRLREGGASATAFQRLTGLLRAARIKSFVTDPNTDPRDLQVFGHLLLGVHQRGVTPEEMLRELKVQSADSLEVTIDAAGEEEDVTLLEGRQLQKRVYTYSIGVLKAVFHETREKDRMNSRRVKRVVQQMMESVEQDSGYALSLTSVKNYDEYTFNHSVNVGVLAIALGRAIGLPRQQLYAVGQAGMLHDLGKLCVSKEILNKPGALTPDERQVIQRHPSEGFLLIASNQGVSAETIGVALGAYEHHLNVDGSGYPGRTVTRPMGLLSRIVAIVDRYDAMTSVRVYHNGMTPPRALALLHHRWRDQVDQTILRYFMNMLGTFPLGTVVRLSDSSVCIVVGEGSIREMRHLPEVRTILDDKGREARPETIDLSVRAKEPDALSVVETLRPTDFGIEVMDYLD